MIKITGNHDLHTIVVMNPKGGCGKTTLATNIAAYYASRGETPTLVDGDPQGFSSGWLEKRPEERSKIHGLRIFDRVEKPEQVIEVPEDSNIAVIDLPAAIRYDRLHTFTYIADSLLLPIQPSEIDVYSATRFIAELLLDAQLDRSERRLAIVANRVRSNTKSYARLVRFLSSLKIPLIASLRDGQSYVHAAAHGLGVCELPASRVKDDLVGLGAVIRWLDERGAELRRQRQRRALIESVAARLSESRGGAGGDELEDWLEAERTVDTQLAPVVPD